MNKPIYLRMSLLDISKTLMYKFWYDLLKQSIKKKQNYAIWILTALLFILKPKIFMKTLLMMLKNGLTHLTMMRMIRPLPIGKNKKVIALFKDELGANIMIEFFGPRAKTYAYLMILSIKKLKKEKSV